MKNSFIIYIKAVGLYALLTLPAMFFPAMYMISLYFVIIYGWFAWMLFALIYVIVDKIIVSYFIRMLFLFIAVPLSVAFCFQMLDVLNVENDVWNTGSFLLFPLAATVSGWISLYLTRKQIKIQDLKDLQFVTDKPHTS